jgi:hypothetical protein
MGLELGDAIKGGGDLKQQDGLSLRRIVLIGIISLAATIFSKFFAMLTSP